MSHPATKLCGTMCGTVYFIGPYFYPVLFINFFSLMYHTLQHMIGMPYP